MALNSRSYAKINLFLNVVGKRHDGYHLLESLFTLIDIYDDITVEPEHDISIKTNSSIAQEDNIVFKLAHKLKNTYKIGNGAKFHITKHIPISAGLGGGSSNAATALNLLCELWQIEMTLQEKIEFGLSLGADVPFFIVGKTAIVKGIGEQISPITLNKTYNLLLVNPGVHVSTKDVFMKGFNQFSLPITDTSASNLNEIILNGRNDLENNTTTIEPVVAELLKELNTLQGSIVSRMSGSGATCFALFSTREQLQNAVNHFRNKGFWTHSQELLI